MWKEFIGWLFSEDSGGLDGMGGTGLRLFWLTCFVIALWFSLLGGILMVRTQW
jgi:hypothetical protein